MSGEIDHQYTDLDNPSGDVDVPSSDADNMYIRADDLSAGTDDMFRDRDDLSVGVDDLAINSDELCCDMDSLSCGTDCLSRNADGMSGDADHLSGDIDDRDAGADDLSGNRFEIEAGNSWPGFSYNTTYRSDRMYTKGKKITGEIGLRLQEARQQAGLSAKEMAARLGITTGGYQKNEGGINIPNIDSLRHLTLDFDISMDWLLFKKGPRYFKEKNERERELEQTVAELNQSEAALKNEIAELKNKLQETQPMIAYGKAGSIEMIPEVRELLALMEQDPVFYHRLMLYFQEFKLRKQVPGELGKDPLPEL